MKAPVVIRADEGHLILIETRPSRDDRFCDHGTCARPRVHGERFCRSHHWNLVPKPVHGAKS